MKPCKRRFKSPFVLLAVVALAFSACAGQQSALLPSPLGSAVQGNTLRMGSPISSGQLPRSDGTRRPAGRSLRPTTAGKQSLTVTGQITLVGTGGFVINVSQGCSVGGNSPLPVLGAGGRPGGASARSLMIVTTNSATTLMGGSPAVGLYAEATGTGSCTLVTSQAPSANATPCAKSNIICVAPLYPSITAGTVTLSRVPFGQTPCTNQTGPPAAAAAYAKINNPVSVGGNGQGCTGEQNCGSQLQQAPPATGVLSPVSGPAAPAASCSPSACVLDAQNPAPCATGSPVAQQSDPSPAASPPGSPAPAVSPSAPAVTPSPTASPTPGPPH